MKKVMGIVVIILGVVVAFAIVAFSIYWYRNMHWYDKYNKLLNEVGAKKKQITLPSGNIINYGEVKNDKPALRQWCADIRMGHLLRLTLRHTAGGIS